MCGFRHRSWTSGSWVLLLALLVAVACLGCGDDTSDPAPPGTGGTGGSGVGGGTGGSPVTDDHPRIWLTPERLTELRQRACYDEQGNPVANCTASDSWSELASWVEANMATDFEGSDYFVLEAQSIVNFAVAYQITSDPTYGRAAIDKMLHLWDHPHGSSLDDWIGQNNWYGVRYLVSGSALVFDWCFDQLTADEQSRFVAQLDRWGQMITTEITDADWAWESSESNYWYGYVWALATTGYALHNHADNASDYVAYVTDTMVPEALHQVNGEPLAWPVGTGAHPNGGSQGGEWSEGNSYGSVNTDFLASTLFALQSAQGIDRFADTSFFEEHLLMLIHAKPPGGDFFVVAGDSSESFLSGSGKIRIPLSLSIAAARQVDASSVPAAYGQHWLDTYTNPAFVNDYKLFNEFIWYEPQGQSVDYGANGAATDYFAPGMQIQTARTDWSDGAAWFYGRFNAHYADHTYDGQGGHFSLWKDGWLIKDHAHGGYPSRDAAHNVVYLPPDADSDNGMLWHQPTILHRETTPAYVYYAADASNVFSGEDVNCEWRACNVELNQRSLFFLREGQLIVYDRIRTAGAADTKAWQIYFEASPNDEGDNTWSTTSSGSKLFLKTLLPASVTASAPEVDGDYRLRVTPSTPAQYVTFLHVLEMVDGNPSAMGPAVAVTSSAANMVGSLVDGAHCVMLSEDGAEVNSTTYDIAPGASAAVDHYVTSLAPNTIFTVTGPGLSSSATSSAGGVLLFSTTGDGTVSVAP